MAIEHLMRFDEVIAKRFETSYKKAVEAGADQFTFDGGDFLVSYAKYVLEYLRMRGVLH